MNTVRQCKLKCNNIIMVTWLDAATRVGNKLSLIGGDGVWEVMTRSRPRLFSKIKDQNDRLHGGMFGSIV